MLFPTVQFAIFFTVVFLGNWLLMQHPIRWRWFMLAASYFFYGYWDYRFIALLAGSTLFNQAVAVAITRRRFDARVLVAIGVAGNLMVLAFFKYYGFFVTSVAAGTERLGFSVAPPLLDIILPVGISFFTFQALSYVIDVFRGRLEAASTLDFAVYLAFFPQLVAGPIVRGSEFLPQMARPRDPRRLDATRAFYLILIGLAKKIVIADFLASNIVDAAFATPGQFSSLELLIALYAYSVQIYADFSAYSDIAIGVAQLLGFQFPDNFNSPYAAVSIQDFWRRWHMTLSRWLRDYLYIPLGGNRGSSLVTYRNLMLTMLLGGLWHGASWTFVFWGGLHGVWLVWEHRRQELRVRRDLPAPADTPGRRVVRRVITFHLVAFAWVFFRSPSFSQAWEFISRLVTGGPGTGAISLGILLAIAVGIGAQYVPKGAVSSALDRLSRLRPSAQGALLGIALVAIDALGPQGVASFIYFQF